MNSKITSPLNLTLIAVIFCAFSVLGVLYMVNWDLGANFGLWKKAFEIMTGFWLSFVMMAAVLIALRIPLVEKMFGGLSEGYRWHRWLGITSAVLLFLHWAAARGPAWLTALGITQGRGHRGPFVHATPPEWWETLLRYMQNMGEWLGYVMIILLILSLFCKFIRQTPWLAWHRLFGILTFLGAIHGIGSIPSKFYSTWVMALTILITLLCAWLLVKEIDYDFKDAKKGLVMKTKPLGNNILEVWVKTPKPVKIAPSQFMCLSFDKKEHPHPFTVVSSSTSDNETEFSVVIKGLGEYTNSLLKEVLDGSIAYYQGPYGEYLKDVQDKNQLWIAGGVGITPFLSAMQTKAAKPTVLIWSIRSPSDDFRALVEEKTAEAGVKLYLIDTGKDQRIGKSVTIRSLVPDIGSYQCWYCGPKSLLKAVKAELKPFNVKVNSEHFNWR